VLDAGAKEVAQPPPPRRRLSPGPGLAAREVASHQLARIHDATIEIVAESGYQALKVRDVVRRAEVSTRAFYQHFGSKEDCFLQTYRLVSRRATRRIISAQAGEPDWRKRPRLVFEGFVRELESEPAGARLALIEAYTAEATLAEAWRVERVFESMLAEAFSRTPKGVAVPPLIVQGMVAGVAAVSRSRLLTGKVSNLANNGGDLVNWAMCYPDPAAAQLTHLDGQSVWRDTALESFAGASSRGGDVWPSGGDRALILNAVAELAAAKGYAGLTAPRIRSAAGVSRRKFEAYFDDVEGCYLTALEQHAEVAMTQVARAQAAAGSRAGGIYRAISALADCLIGDPFLARVCLTDDFPPGPNGTRARQRLIDAAVEMLTNTPSVTSLATEASTGAVWSLLYHYVIRNQSSRRPIAATLAYLALAPTIGAPGVIDVIRGEQEA
jgi:AcrR family transcriptional regulator